MKLSQKAERELLELAMSDELKKDFEALKTRWRHPFLKNGETDVEAYIEFVTQFNEFINHEPKPFEPMIDRDMRL